MLITFYGRFWRTLRFLCVDLAVRITDRRMRISLAQQDSSFNHNNFYCIHRLSQIAGQCCSCLTMCLARTVVSDMALYVPSPRSVRDYSVFQHQENGGGLLLPLELTERRNKVLTPSSTTTNIVSAVRLALVRERGRNRQKIDQIRKRRQERQADEPSSVHRSETCRLQEEVRALRSQLVAKSAECERLKQALQDRVQGLTNNKQEEATARPKTHQRLGPRNLLLGTRHKSEPIKSPEVDLASMSPFPLSEKECISPPVAELLDSFKSTISRITARLVPPITYPPLLLPLLTPAWTLSTTSSIQLRPPPPQSKQQQSSRSRQQQQQRLYHMPSRFLLGSFPNHRHVLLSSQLAVPTRRAIVLGGGMTQAFCLFPWVPPPNMGGKQSLLQL